MTYWNINMYKLKDCTCTNLCRCANQVGVDSSCLCDRSIWSCGDRICLLYTWSAWIKGSSQVLRVYNPLWGLTRMSHPESGLSSDGWVFWWCLYWLLCADWQMWARQAHRSHPGEWRAGGGEKGPQSALLDKPFFLSHLHPRCSLGGWCNFMKWWCVRRPSKNT